MVFLKPSRKYYHHADQFSGSRQGPVATGCVRRCESPNSITRREFLVAQIDFGFQKNLFHRASEILLSFITSMRAGSADYLN